MLAAPPGLNSLGRAARRGSTNTEEKKINADSFPDIFNIFEDLSPNQLVVPGFNRRSSNASTFAADTDSEPDDDEEGRQRAEVEEWKNNHPLSPRASNAKSLSKMNLNAESELSFNIDDSPDDLPPTPTSPLPILKEDGSHSEMITPPTDLARQLDLMVHTFAGAISRERAAEIYAEHKFDASSAWASVVTLVRQHEAAERKHLAASTAQSQKPAESKTQSKNLAKPNMQVDVLAYMKTGTTFLKYTGNGFPHFRQVQLSFDNTKLVWFSQGKSLKERQVLLSEVHDIRQGQTTAKFTNSPCPSLEKSSFSIIYGSIYARKSLDLIAKDLNDYSIWYFGLVQLVKMTQEKALSPKTDSVVLELGIMAGRRSSATIVDIATGFDANKTAGPVVLAAIADHDNKRRAAHSTQLTLAEARVYI
jgi:hypothetical protein